MNFKEELTGLTALVDNYLKDYFERLVSEVPETTLIESMQYSMMAGGKRIRPVLTLAVAKMMSADLSEVMPFAAAIEMIHTYSLIHDDLPAMDNDDYRRGKLTNHKVYGEAMAILAGDALLNEAFNLLFKTASEAGEKMEMFVKSSCVIAGAAGKDGMIAGQVISICSRRGIKVPEQMKVIGYDDIDLCKIFNPSITTIRQSIDEICMYAVESIITKAEEEKPIPSCIIFPVKLVERETT
jgi:geranylgeranyl pyrophosphate synthase